MAGFPRTIRAWVAIPVAMMTVGALMLMAGVALADQPGDLHCPDGWLTKDDSGYDDNDYVPEAGLLICVKAGSVGSNDTGAGSTGIIETDGVSTLQEYLYAAGIVDGSGEQGRDVSYWVTYEEESPSPSESVLPSEEESPSPSESVLPSEEESPSPSESVLPSEVASASPTGGQLPGVPSPGGGTLPSTSIPVPGSDLAMIGSLLLLAGSAVGAIGVLDRRAR